ncbi:MAG: hypothetical protein HN356_11270 [Calditrichaeota bacterium]|nr:hypothetical protein [Calditrichota bacterium]
MLRITIFLLTISLLLFSCSDDFSPSEPEPEHFSIRINELPRSIKGIVGTTQETSFYVALYNEDYTVAEDEEITITDASGIGQVTPEEAVTNEAGEVSATYQVVIPAEETTARIRVSVNNQTESDGMYLIPIRRPETIRFEAIPQPFKVDLNTEAVIPVTAIVIDAGGNAVEEVNVNFRLESVGNQDAFGSVISSVATNNSGTATTTFRSFNQYGYVQLVARIDEPGFNEEVIGSLRFEIRPLYVPNSIFIQLTNDEFKISQMSPRDTTYTSIIKTIVTDENGVAIPEIPLLLNTTHGRIIDNVLNFNPEFDMEGNDPFQITITGYNPDRHVDGSAEIFVNYLDDLPSLTLGSDRLLTEADGPGGSHANLHVTLATPQGTPVEGVEITIRGTEDICVIQSPVVTDSMGSATAVFDDIGNPGLVAITAESKYGVSESINIEIGEYFSHVERISLGLENNRMRANSNDSTLVTAICSLVDGFPARRGTTVNFRAIYGSFTDQTVPINRADGIAETFYIAGNQVRTDIVEAFVVEEEDTVFSNRVEVILRSGPPSIIVVHSSPNELLTNDPTAHATITATVMDTSSNPVRAGTFVTFSSTLGTIGQSAETDLNGDAVVLLNPGGQSGLAVITASVDGDRGQITAQATVNFIAGTPEFIELTHEESGGDGRGGIHSVFMRATVRDMNGNLIMVPTPVVFEMVNEPNPPEGTSIAGAVDGKFVSTTSGGVAVATLNPGTLTGPKLIRAYTWRDSAARPDDFVSTVYNGFAVLNGPPTQIEISVSNNGIDAGGGAWAIEVSARVWDENRNPVDDRIPVVFTVEPEIANIEAGWTGNINRNGESFSGLAFAALVYNSVSSLEEITISAVVQSENGRLENHIEHILPVLEGVVSIHEAGGDFIFDDEDEVLEAQFTAFLFDGHEIRIENATFTYTADFGEFDPEQPGNWSASMDDVFFDPDINEQVVRFRVRVDGTDIVSEPLEVVVRRR